MSGPNSTQTPNSFSNELRKHQEALALAMMDPEFGLWLAEELEPDAEFVGFRQDARVVGQTLVNVSNRTEVRMKKFL